MCTVCNVPCLLGRNVGISMFYKCTKHSNCVIQIFQFLIFFLLDLSFTERNVLKHLHIMANLLIMPCSCFYNYRGVVALVASILCSPWIRTLGCVPSGALQYSPAGLRHLPSLVNGVLANMTRVWTELDRLCLFLTICWLTWDHAQAHLLETF